MRTASERQSSLLGSLFIKLIDNGLKPLKYGCAPYLHGGREIAGFDRQRLRQDCETPDMLDARMAAVDRVYAGLQLLTDRVFDVRVVLRQSALRRERSQGACIQCDERG